MKRMVWTQIEKFNGDTLYGKKILDFGSGLGVTADYFAARNDVTAIEPDSESVATRFSEHDYLQLVGSLDALKKLPTASSEHDYLQLVGSLDALKKLPTASFDFIICHNVLEYVEDKSAIMCELLRLLKVSGTLSIVKHNRPGRVMQMVILLDDFEQANALLDGNNGVTSKFGAIDYYDDADFSEWTPELSLQKTFGMRTFWDLQQDQTQHDDPAWQEKMLDIESRVAELPSFQAIAFFHHLLFQKTSPTD